ncbi:raffinose/stachyose/melibiose transport system substrate-binding protein [Paenibacillus castaneae]|uniref:extracellular solute-binding protein n=1 Tax=Paenibacillus castaneae TaxID=474957 RepID=UPI000C9C9B77|nr:extracellular solute-binding protein [Paenibacillus castaneae]NIK75113.1 raffinose/stachyose/melibiose transport system substrate-binding protein [Paenibacillus castaneae]
MSDICKLRTLLFIVFFILSGCASNAAEGVTDAERKDFIGTSAKIKLTLTDSWLATSTAAVDVVHRSLIEQFVREHPQVELSEDILDNASLKTKIKTLAAANSLPDVFMMLGSDAKMLLDNDLIMPMENIMDQDSEWKQGFRPQSFEDFMFDGVLAGVPMQLTATSIIYYNEIIFRQAGYYTFPKTWDEFIEAVKRIKEIGYTPIAMGNKDQWVAGSCLLSALADRFTGTEWFRSIEENSGAAFTDRPFVNALAAMKQLSEIGAFSEDMISMDNAQQRSPYYLGKAAMFMEGGWAVSSVVADAPKSILDYTHLALLPPVNGGRGQAGTAAGGSGWAIALNSNLEGERLAEAIELVKLLTGEAAANRMAERGDISGSFATNYDKSSSSPLFEQYLDLLQKAKLTPVFDVRLAPEVVLAMNAGLQQLLLPESELTPEVLAQDIQAAYDRMQMYE